MRGCSLTWSGLQPWALGIRVQITATPSFLFKNQNKIMRVRTKRPEWQQDIAKERIAILFNLAKKDIIKNPERAKRYVELARKIGLRYNVRLGKAKRDFCKNCFTILLPGITSQVRVDKGEIVIKCLKCQKKYRYPYK